MKETAWVAGLYEGEGFLSYRSNDTWVLGVRMTDLDVIEHLQEVTGIGIVSTYKPSKPHHKQIHLWSIHRRLQVASTIDDLYPYMGKRRQAKFDEFRVWNLAKPVPTSGYGTATTCWRGHQKDRVNKRGYLECRECARIRQRSYYRKTCRLSP